jgi:ArsR family transcriptional regulator, arsenate/arsenite/antimonite-responsive transcriptional repressor
MSIVLRNGPNTNLMNILTTINVLGYALHMEKTAAANRVSSPAPEPCCVPPQAPGLAPPEAATLAERLKTLADPTRLRMLDLLAQGQEPLCVCHITERFSIHQPTISHHLRLLREAGLVDCEKRGVWAYYWATDEGRRSLSLVKTLL